MKRVEKTVFISYRRTNVPWALAISQNLINNGFDAFVDYQGIASGDFAQVILENIRARAHFLVLLTPSALDRCNDPGDWFRREIEEALETKRNIVPLMLENFDYSTPAIASKLAGKLVLLNRYNGMTVPVEYFDEAMTKLREKFLNVPLEAVLHPASTFAQQAAKNQKTAAAAAPPVQQRELTAQKWFERGFNADDLDEQMRHYTEAIRLDPAYAAAYNNRGNARHKKGDLDGAMEDYEEAIRLDPAYAGAYNNRGNAHHKKADLDGADESAIGARSWWKRIPARRKSLAYFIVVISMAYAFWMTLPDDTKKAALSSTPKPVSKNLSACPGIGELSSGHVNPKEQNLKLALLKSGDIAYVRNIASAFMATLDACAKAAGFTVQWEEAMGPIAPETQGTRQEWDEKIQLLKKRTTPHYWITIGTQASVNLRRSLAKDYYTLSIVFAGVTDPVCSGLVLEETHRNDAAKLGGVRYGGEPNDYIAKIAKFFPDRKIQYVYHKDHQQDACFAQRLANNPLVTAKRLSFKPLSHMPTLTDLPDTETVYFSWYTFEEMFENNQEIDILKKRLVVATTKNNVEGTDLAPLGVVGDDVEIGQKAATVLLRDLFSIRPLNQQDIEKPNYNVYVNCETAEKRKLLIPPDMVQQFIPIRCPNR